MAFVEEVISSQELAGLAQVEALIMQREVVTTSNTSNGPVRTVTTSTARYAPYNRPMPPPNTRSENVASSSSMCHSHPQPPRNHLSTSSAVQPYVSKPMSLEIVPQQVRVSHHSIRRITHRPSNLHVQHPSSMVPARPLGSTGGNRASDGGALESNGIIVGNKNEFKEVRLSERYALVHFNEFQQYTEWCKNCLDDSDFIMVGGGKFVVKKSGWRKLGAAQGVSYEIRKNDIIYDERGDVSRADFTVRASLATGRFSDGWGSCDRKERRQWTNPNHIIPSMAETRAKSRAISDLLGVGDAKE